MQHTHRSERRVRVYWRGHIGGATPQHPMQVLDISEGGMSILADASFHRGALVAIHWVGPSRPDEAERVLARVKMKVAYCILSTEGFKIGGSLVELPVDAAEILWRHLNFRRPQVDLSSF
jgi:hypothetical protein